MPPVQQTPIQNQKHHNKPLFFSALIISLGILIFAIWYGYDKQAQQTRDIETARLIANTSVNTTDETVNWKTYTNKEYGFEIKIPSDWIIKKVGTTTLHFISKSTTDAVELNEYNCSGKGSCNPETLDRDMEFTNIDNYLEKDFVRKSYSVNIAGVSWLNYIKDGLFSNSNYLTKDDGLTYNFEIYDTSSLNDPLLKQILSTFKFISTSTPQ